MAEPAGLSAAIPILRIFSVEKAMEFYLGFLGFRLDWEHRFEPGMPLYAQVSRDALVLHLSEHFGDTTPGTRIFVPVANARALQAELAARDFPFMRPGLETVPWGLEVTVTDPFANRITFCQRNT
ncbi:bleomycin resistance protein [Xaviernesmea oryzae]|uniref:Bleomycin resistance protein n=1 Tax=Xaviernesmea oryzae TaxID=464029 RepID=A0A1Q9ASQ0_9HYPH|nr:bleomycin resistance protein [Xaviernesmea oryzae]SEL41541.1 hypothetical protein SAMN04487976_10824 [Xaviernesmea oryzae]